MTLIPLNIQPGFNKEVPSLTSDPAWRDGDKVRFVAGQPEKMGGWLQAGTSGSNTVTGVARSIKTWRLNNGLIVTAIGTNEKLHLYHDGLVTDITPIRETQNTLGTDPFDTTSGSTTVTVTDTTHGSENGDYVTFSGAVCATLTDSEVNANHKITLVDANTYTFEVTTAATSTDANDGGSSVVGAYEIGIGAVSTTTNYGFGSGAYGLETYGDERTISSSTISLRYWSMDNFGEDLVACHEGSPIYLWQYSGNFTDRATLLSNSPSANELVVVTSPDRHLVALASETTGTQDKLMVVWADQETTNTWTGTAENTAGFQALSGGSEIKSVYRAENSTLIWTDTSLLSMQFLGPPFTFGFTELDINCGAISKACTINVGSRIFWMGRDDFFVYDGSVKRIHPCTVHRHVFKNIREAQKEKIIAGLIKEFDEIIWFYPNDDDGEINSYVIYNYEANIWYTGSMVRTAWEDTELLNNPLGINTGGTLYDHEMGVDDDTSALTAYVETAEFDIQEGDRFFFVSRALPDMTIDAGSVDYIFKTRRYPHSTQATDTTSTVSSSTEKMDLRIRTRNLVVRVESDALLDDWRMGTLRLDGRPDGRR